MPKQSVVYLEHTMDSHVFYLRESDCPYIKRLRDIKKIFNLPPLLRAQLELRLVIHSTVSLERRRKTIRALKYKVGRIPAGANILYW